MASGNTTMHTNGSSRSVASGSAAARETRRERLRTIIQTLSVLRGDFTLASGRKSKVFFDIKKSVLDPEGANLIAEEMLNRLHADTPEYIGGLVMGAVPVVQAICVKSFPDNPIKAFFVRSDAKGHGTNQIVEGHLEKGATVVVVDDVTTTGGSVMKAVREVRARDCPVTKVLTIVDRLEGARDALAKEGIELVALFTKEDFDL